jgi:hypothetical protein
MSVLFLFGGCMEYSNTLFAVPAYGRTYETESAMLDDWRDGKDFKVDGGSAYFSIRDVGLLVADGYRYVHVHKVIINLEGV